MNVLDKLDVFIDKIIEKGHKLTKQRKIILEFLLNIDGEHLNSEEIYANLKKDFPDIGIATVYRTLVLFEKLGIVQKIDLDDGYSRYEIYELGQKHRHHHLICTRCGGIQEVKYDLLDTIEEQIMNKNNFLIKDHNVKFYGYCSNCQ